MNGKPKKIYCPRCNHRVGQWDGRSEIPYEKMCKWCRKLIVFDPLRDKVDWYPFPDRTCSSGERFY